MRLSIDLQVARYCARGRAAGLRICGKHSGNSACQNYGELTPGYSPLASSHDDDSLRSACILLCGCMSRLDVEFQLRISRFEDWAIAYTGRLPRPFIDSP